MKKEYFNENCCSKFLVVDKTNYGGYLYCKE